MLFVWGPGSCFSLTLGRRVDRELGQRLEVTLLCQDSGKKADFCRVWLGLPLTLVFQCTLEPHLVEVPVVFHGSGALCLRSSVLGFKCLEYRFESFWGYVCSLGDHMGLTLSWISFTCGTHAGEVSPWTLDTHDFWCETSTYVLFRYYRQIYLQLRVEVTGGGAH